MNDVKAEVVRLIAIGSNLEIKKTQLEGTRTASRSVWRKLRGVTSPC